MREVAIFQLLKLVFTLLPGRHIITFAHGKNFIQKFQKERGVPHLKQSIPWKHPYDLYHINLVFDDTLEPR